MTKRNKYQILFFEENEDEYGFDLIKMYMNRLTIDEDVQFEIIGLTFLQKSIVEDFFPEPQHHIQLFQHDPDSFEDKRARRNYPFKRPKLKNDENTLEHLILEAKQLVLPESDLHILIGSKFHHQNFGTWTTEFKKWIFGMISG